MFTAPVDVDLTSAASTVNAIFDGIGTVAAPMVTSPASASITLLDAAFGASPATWPLPCASTPQDAWLRAIALGGAGRYAAAHAELSAIPASRPGGLASLALSTRASLLRQLAWHTHARGFDGRALSLAGSDAEARSDALVGLAADALGLARFPQGKQKKKARKIE